MTRILFRKLNELTSSGQLIEHNMVSAEIEPDIPSGVPFDYLKTFEAESAILRPYTSEIHSTLYFSQPWVMEGEGEGYIFKEL